MKVRSDDLLIVLCTYELAQPRCCQSGWLAIPRSILCLDVFFLHGVDHAPTNKWKACLFVICFYCPKDMTDARIQKNAIWTKTCLKKKKGKGRLSICLHMCFKYEMKNSDRNSQNWAGHHINSNVTCSRHFWNTYLMSRNRFLFVTSLDGWPRGQCNWYRSSPWVFRTLHQISPWSGTTIFGAVTRMLCQNVGKQGTCEFSWGISAKSSRIFKMFAHACMNYTTFLLCQGKCFQFQAQICSGSQDMTSTTFFRFLAGPARSYKTNV